MLCLEKRENSVNCDRFIANRLKIHRRNAGISQTDLGKLVSLSQDAIARMESGERSFKVWEVRMLANALQVEVMDLIG